MEWMFAPIDATRVHDVGWHLSWHARLMVIAWAFLVPSGVLAARFFKILPKQNWPEVRDSKTWWNIHRGFQYTSTVLMITAVILIYNAPPLNISSGPHSYLGWIVLALVGFQIWGGGFCVAPKGARLTKACAEIILICRSNGYCLKWCTSCLDMVHWSCLWPRS